MGQPSPVVSKVEGDGVTPIPGTGACSFPSADDVLSQLHEGIVANAGPVPTVAQAHLRAHLAVGASAGGRLAGNAAGRTSDVGSATAHGSAPCGRAAARSCDGRRST